jgi:hypothetical protein
LPIICAITGRPVGFSVIDRRICGCSFESAWTRKYSVKYKSAPPYRVIKPMKGKSVTSCIGASASTGADPERTASKEEDRLGTILRIERLRVRE